MSVLLKAEGIIKHFKVKAEFFTAGKAGVHALDGLSLDVSRGKTTGIVGESGCGKSTLARIMAGLIEPDSGKVFFEGKDITGFKNKDVRFLRKDIQMVFQDPYASLNPRMKAGSIVSEPLRVNNILSGSALREKTAELFETVGLDKDALNRYPHQFSGGQRQRVGIARALSLNPKLIIADEPVSALDVSIQAQILNLLHRLREGFGLTYVFIAHDLRVVRYISDEIAVMYLGKIVERGNCAKIYKCPFHPYTQAMLSAIPGLNFRGKKRIILRGDVPSPLNPPSGCRFHTRCIYAQDKCSKIEPQLTGSPERAYACHYPLLNKI